MCYSQPLSLSLTCCLSGRCLAASVATIRYAAVHFNVDGKQYVAHANYELAADCHIKGELETCFIV